MTPKQKTETTTQKWAPFTCIGRETTFITNLLQKADLRIALRTNNTLQKPLIPKPQTLDKYGTSGAYKLTCPDYKKSYVQQTGQSFTQSFKEHKNAFRSNKTLQTTPNTLWNMHTRLTPIMKQCRFCNTKVREPKSTP